MDGIEKITGRIAADTEAEIAAHYELTTLR